MKKFAGKLLIVCSILFLVLTMCGAVSAEEGAKININTAGVDELTQLDQVGPSKAEKIVQYRQENGPFEKIEDIVNVSGIGQSTFDKNKDRITVGEVAPKN